MRFVLLLIGLLACFGIDAAYAADRQEIDVAGMKVVAWLPQDAHAPVIVFSHGFHGCNTQSTFLMEALANDGYAVFAPNHADAACRVMAKWRERSEEPFRESDKWNDKTYAGRAQNIHFLLDALQNNRKYAGLDWNHVGIAGHSLGGYTALGVAGGWSKWKDKRIKAVLALSPYAAPFIYRKTLGNLQVPVMYQGGTDDPGITPFINKGGGAYDQSKAPKMYVEFEGAGHFAWTDLNPKYHDLIDRYSLAFFDHYLKGKPFPQDLNDAVEGVSQMRAEMEK